MTVNKEAMRLWIDALRSGEFKQGWGRLHKPGNLDAATPEKYCCLGVACVVALREGGIETLPWERTLADDLRSFSFPQGDVDEWFGVRLQDLGLGEAGERPSYLNDEVGWSFDQIADALEATYFPKEETSGVESGESNDAK